jgi:hypothetical protein
MTTRQVEKMARQHELPCIEIAPNELRFEQAALAQWLKEARTTQPDV